MAWANHAAVGPHHHAVVGFVDLDRRGVAEGSQARPDGLGDQRLRESKRIDLTIAARADGPGRPDRRNRAQLVVRQVIDVEPEMSPAFQLPLEPPAVPPGAGKIQGLAAGEAAIVSHLRSQLFDFVDRRQSPAIRMNGVLRADFLDQIAQRRVDLILQQARAGGRAAVADLAAVQQHRGHALLDKLVGDQGAGNTPSQNHYPARSVFRQRRKLEPLPAAVDPQCAARSKIHANSLRLGKGVEELIRRPAWRSESSRNRAGDMPMPGRGSQIVRRERRLPHSNRARARGISLGEKTLRRCQTIEAVAETPLQPTK